MRCACALAIALGLVACDDGSGSDACGMTNAEISMVATVVDNGSNIYAEVDFAPGGRVGAPGPFALCGGDRLTIAGESADRTDRADRVVYSASLDPGAVRTVPFSLERAGESELAFTIQLAPPFEILTPMPADEVSRAQDFVLSWAPALEGGEIRIGLAEEIGYGICLETTVADHDYKGETGVAVADDGDWNIPASVIDGGTRDKCDATYRLTRFTTPDYPGELHTGGFLEGRVERFVAFVSVP